MNRFKACFIVFLILLPVLAWLTLFNRSNIVDVSFEQTATLPAASEGQNPPLRIAVAAMISPKNAKKYYFDLLRLVGSRLNREVVFAQKKTYAQVNEMVEHREVDLAFVCSGPYVTGHQAFGMELLAAPVVNNEQVYYSYIISNKNSDVQSVVDLRGKKFAFTDPHSNTGCLVPTYMLAKEETSPTEYFSDFFYSFSHDNSIKAVADGLADGAAVDSLIWDFMNQVDPVDTARTKIISKSEPYGIPPIVVHPQLDNTLKSDLRRIFLTLHNSPDAQKLLKKLHIEKFDHIEDSQYDSVRKMQTWLKKNGES